MKYYIVNLGKLLALYLFLVLIAEIASSSYTEYQISLFLMTPFDWKASILGGVVSIGKRLAQFWLYDWQLVGLTVWVFKEKVYYPILVMTALVMITRIREKSLENPEIPNSQRSSSLNDFHKNNMELTKRSVAQLENSKEYKDFLKNKMREQNLMKYQTSPVQKVAHQDDQMWKDVQKQIYAQ